MILSGSTNKTLLGYFYNEASVLLPSWCDHHSKIFNHGILYDYDSTDRGAEVVKKICPTWEVRKTRNKDFDFEAADQELKEAEIETKGWKAILNTTEFFVGKNLVKMLDEADPSIMFFGGLSYFMCDTYPSMLLEFDRKKPIIPQRTFGYYEGYNGLRVGNRYIHRYEGSDYNSGVVYPNGKNTMKGKGEHPDSFGFLWYGFSPWPQVIPRRLQIQHRISERERHLGRGSHHFVNIETLWEWFKENTKKSSDLREDKRFVSWVEDFYPEIKLKRSTTKKFVQTLPKLNLELPKEELQKPILETSRRYNVPDFSSEPPMKIDKRKTYKNTKGESVDVAISLT